MIDRAASIVQHDTVMLRSLMTDLYPPDLEGDGLRDAVEHLLRTGASEAPFDFDLTVPPSLDLSPEAARLVYRITREVLRNVVKHARADRVLVEIEQQGDQVRVCVHDDGRGTGDAPAGPAEGHLGLRLLRDTLVDFGGELAVRSPASGGTLVEARFPAVLVPF